MANQSALLSPGSRLQTMYSRRSVIVGDMLGGGGQGQVFRAQFEDSFCALKWYNPGYLGIDHPAGAPGEIDRGGSAQ